MKKQIKKVVKEKPKVKKAVKKGKPKKQIEDFVDEEGVESFEASPDNEIQDVPQSISEVQLAESTEQQLPQDRIQQLRTLYPQLNDEDVIGSDEEIAARASAKTMTPYDTIWNILKGE